MSGSWTHALFSAAELSNILSAVGVLLCFTCMVIFILKVQDVQLNPSSVVHVSQPPVIQVQYKKVEVPFTCTLTKVLSNEELVLRVKSNVASQLEALWLVPSDKLRNFLYLPWGEFEESFNTDQQIGAHSTQFLKNFDEDNLDDVQNIVIKIKSDLPTLGEPPRQHFPLVLRMMRAKTTKIHSLEDVGALISIFHLSDEFCPMPSAILFHYLKQYSGQVTQLQNLYTQRPESVGSRADKEDDQSECSDEGACVICRVMPPTRALLPCRHVCICCLCFDRLEDCPLCRTRISAFFPTDTKEELRQKQIGFSETEESSNLRRHQSFLNNMNNVLNSFLGLNER